MKKKKLTGAPFRMPCGPGGFDRKRKNTCRAIAQWAINSVDMRDSDVIMTPFEYDENPGTAGAAWIGTGT